ncbi:MAG: carbamoyltransferase N-terminal domain-containing protein, partial [Nitrospinota bacterium]
MIVLGINDGHCATAALLKDGEVLGCVSEERFTRNKNESGYPRLSIEWLLASQRLKPQELDAIALAGEEAIEPAWFFRVTRDDAYIDEYLGLRDGGPGGRLREKLRRFFSKLSLTSEQRGKRPFTLAERHRAVREHLGVEEGCIHQVEHHTAHAAAAYWASPYGAAGREATILTNDAAGDGLCATWSIGGRQGLKRLSASPSAAGSLGSFYSLVTLFLGMRQLEHEYKVMGLAPYAPEAGIKRSYEVFRQMIEFSPGDPPCFRWKVRRARFRYMMERLARHRFDWVAAAAQSLLEEMLEEWAVLGLERAGSPRLACSGGVFMNVKANKRLSELAQVEELYVLPSCGDESN